MRIAHRMVALVGASLIALGVVAFAAPEFAARAYGAPIESAQTRVFVWATGARDLAIGVWLLAFLAADVSPRTIGISILAATLIPVADLVIVAFAGSPDSRASLVLHAGGIVVFVILGSWLLRAEDGRS